MTDSSTRHDAADQLTFELTRQRAAASAARKIRRHDLGTHQATTLVMAALWPHAYPHDAGSALWWSSPLGSLCARSLAETLRVRGDEPITHTVAAEILAVQRGTIGRYVQGGYLDRYADGEGVSLASVLARVGR